MGVIVLPPAPVEGSSAADASVRDSMRADKLRRGLSWTLYALALAIAFEGASRLALSNEAFRRRVGANGR
jgi:hypothetical protein